MSTTKAAIKEILEGLDITDDANWTEDGAPALDIVQGLADDATITRDDINAADPGFARMVGEKADKNTTIKNTRVVAAETTNETATGSAEISTERMREILDRRVVDAQNNLAAAQKAHSEAGQEVTRCQQRLQRAHDDHERQYPKVTPAQAIKDHLAAQVRQSQVRAGLIDANDPVTARPQIDQTMERNNRRGTGQTRPTRPVMGGKLVTAA